MNIERARSARRVADIGEFREGGWMEICAVPKFAQSGGALLPPSYSGGLRVVVLEALALGTSGVLTTIAGILKRVDDECGWVFSPEDEDSLVATMRSALEGCPAAMQLMSQARYKHMT